MFYQARIRLTLLYSAIFLVLFWVLSLGIYLWMNRYFGDESSRNNYIEVHHERALLDSNTSTDPPSDIVMDELRNLLIFLDILLLLGIPVITWFLTGRTLEPVQKAHDREKQFLADASHDLRTPLSILSSGMEVALRKERTKKEYENTLKSSKEEVDDLTALVENMLFFAREDKRQQNLQKEYVDLTDIVAERIAFFQQPAKDKKLQLIFNPNNQSSVIEGNSRLLKRLFTSLLDNAVKYTQSGGKIVIKMKKDAQYVYVRISDTGVGIPIGEQEKVFDRFYRADHSRSEKGYGLGLSIAKQIVSFHNGNIHLDSKVQEGTTITVSFPVTTQTRENNLS